MIHKITKIKNLGKFKNPTFGKDNWNGIFEKTNVIYANNGSGKTTLSLLFRSLKGNNELLSKKKTFNSNDLLEVNLFDENKKELNYTNEKWNRHIKKIEIFDSYYAEDNVYVISIKESQSTSTVFEILLGEESIELRKNIDDLITHRKRLKNKKSNIRRTRNKSKNSKLISDLTIKMSEILEEKKLINAEIKETEAKLTTLSKKHKDQYLEKINYYLQIFNPNLKLKELKQYNLKAVYSLEISGHTIKKQRDNSLKYSLSEGDKNALSLSFFFAKLDLLNDISEYTLIIDDPISSFDYARKSSTISILIYFSKKVSQLILLTHDLKFAFDFSRKINYKCINIKINSNSSTSNFKMHDIESENLTGIFKDLSVLNQYLQNGCQNDIERREVIRCIRPCIEGIFRIKFFGELSNNEWLGDIIERIKTPSQYPSYAKYQNLLNEIIEINDYSKEYHHSNPYYFETSINDYELTNFVIRTLDLIKNI